MMCKHALPVLLLLLVSLTGCVEVPQNEMPVPQAEESEAALVQETELFTTAMQADLEALDQDINDVEARLNEAGEDTRLNEAGEDTRMATQERLVALRAQRGKLYQDLQHLETADASTYPYQRAVLAERLRELQTELEATRLHALEARSAFQQAVAERLDELDATLTDLQQRTRMATPEALEREAPEPNEGAIHDATLAALHQQHEELVQQAEAVQAAPEETFYEMKSDLAEAIAALSAEIDALADRMSQPLDPNETTASRSLR